MRRLLPITFSFLPGLLLAPSASAQAIAESNRPAISAEVRRFVQVDAPVIALRHVRVIDGTGAPAREDQTVILRGGTIVAMGADGTVAVPDSARSLDLTGKSLIPGLVMVHEHLFYPTGDNTYGSLSESFTRLYLAGGVTSIRTGGNLNGYGEIEIGKAIAQGRKPGPWMDATAPYLEGPGLPLTQVTTTTTPEAAKRMVDFWADAGATSFKAYMHISRAVLRAAIVAAHARGLKVTGHLCSVTYAEAAELGIDDLEHGFFASTDFVPGKTVDTCVQQGPAAAAAALDTAGAGLKSLIATLVRHKVALTSTQTVFELNVPGRPLPPGLDVLVPQLREDFEQRRAKTAGGSADYAIQFRAGQLAELAFARAGGLLIAGTDPTGGGGVVPGYANQRELELLVESGFTPLEAISIGTLNGARYLGRSALVGSIAVGKQADLVVINGDPSRDITDVRKVKLVFKQGVGYDPEKLIATVRGRVGLF